MTADPLTLSARFERGLDPDMRARLGVYYTAREDILLLVEPVLMQPLRREWQKIQKQACLAPTRRALSLRQQMLHRLRTTTVLDPACGAGNFLVVALESLLALEREIIVHPLWGDLPPETQRVGPRQMFGIEKDPAACDMARTILGEAGEGVSTGPTDVRDHIRCMDAILGLADDGTLYHPEWPAADVILSNPPFLGSRKLRAELGDAYVNALVSLYQESFGKRTPDLVCYWFDQARRHLETGKVARVGMLATNSIRGGTNRRALERIAGTGRIIMAWSDREWHQVGAAVHVSLVGFDCGAESDPVLDGRRVVAINPDLTTGPNLTTARPLPENRRIAFQGIIRRGQFDLTESEALRMLQADSINAEVLKPIWNGDDIASCPRSRWVIDFGLNTPIAAAERYVLPFAYVEAHVRPARSTTRQRDSRERWWLHWNPRPEMRRALAPLRRYIATPAVAKHRIFVWVEGHIHPDHALIVFAREDDYFFGVLHSRIHQLWALRLGTSLEDRPRYTPTTCFETFPLPWPPGGEDTASKVYRNISEAARQLHEARAAWLVPTPGPSPSRWGGEKAEESKPRTLTRLYNALHTYRGNNGNRGKSPSDALEFVPRLDALHRTLDQAVCAAYGWEPAILDDDAAILERLLALNLARSDPRRISESR